MKAVFGMLFALSIIGFIALVVIRSVLGISFEFDCDQYLKRAGDANTVTMAKENVDIAIAYLEKHDLTNGVVSIFFHQPANDIGFFYKNLKSSSDELGKVTDTATQLEKSNLLMKLRETLLDNGNKGGTSVTCPNGITIYPHNVMFFWLFIVSFIPMFFFGIAIYATMD